MEGEGEEKKTKSHIYEMTMTKGKESKYSPTMYMCSTHIVHRKIQIDIPPNKINQQQQHNPMLLSMLID